MCAKQTVTSLERAALFVGDRTLGWGAVCTQAVDVIDVPGDHISAVLNPLVKVLAAELRGILD